MAKEVWRGRSPWDGNPIVGALTEGSRNAKTGNLDTLWILVEGSSPQEAVDSGADAAICGDCPHRHGHGEKGDCYVILGQAVTALAKTLKPKEGE